jgi:LCP family protein required for cell wall assembly
LVIALVAAVSGVQWVRLRGEGVVKGDGEFRTPPSQSAGTSLVPLAEGACSERACNYLILGSDSREGLSPEELVHFGTNQDIGGENRADTIMLVHTDPNGGKATILSFPRDLWVQVPDRGWDKINAGFEGGLEGGGPKLMARTVANLTGLQVDHFLYVDLAGFQHIVETIGGVELCIPAYNADPTTGRIQDELTGLDVAPGCQTLDGSQALAYVRTRHLRCDTIPDFYRIRRQQQFLSALINQMLQPEQLVRAPGLIQPIVGNLHRDEGFLPGDLVYLVGQLRGITSGAADFRSVPGIGGYEGSLSVVHMDPSAQELFRAIREDRSIQGVGEHPLYVPPSEANVKVGVVDDQAGTNAQASLDLLSAAGFDVAPGVLSPGQAGGSPDAKGLESVGAAIAYAPDNDVEAGVVASYFPGLPVVEVDGLAGAPVAVWLTSAYSPEPTGSPSPSGSPAPVAECPSAA